MKNQRTTIRKIVSYLNNPEENGGFWLPNIQRPFVWREEQIERIFDSIMREYPISTMLVWKTKSTIRRRKFIDNYKYGLKLSDYYVPEDDKTKLLVLDGQQRLQSLFIGLKGSYNKKELYLNILSGDLSTPEDIRYKFKFIDKDKAQLPWFRFKDLVFNTKRYNVLSDEIIAGFNGALDKERKAVIIDNIALIQKVFQGDENIVYQELDSVDNPSLYTEDDVVEVFIRANSGGTVLGKSDLLFSLLTASWEDADDNMEELLDDLNKSGFGFDRDFILKTCLTILRKGPRYDVNKFRDIKTKEEIINNWPLIVGAIKDVKDYLSGQTYIRSDKALPSYLVLIPLIYFRYHYKFKWQSATKLDDYILRTSLAGAFSGSPDNLIDKCTKTIDSEQDFNVNEMFGLIRSEGRNLDINKKEILEQYYGSKHIHLIFNIWYKKFNYDPSFLNNSPQVDHIFPQSLLKSIKVANPNTGRMDVLKYRWFDRDQIANCMLLTQQENGAGGKRDIPPHEWFDNKSEDYLDMHFIPKDKRLWKIEKYEEFIEERKKMIQAQFNYLILQDS